MKGFSSAGLNRGGFDDQWVRDAKAESNVTYMLSRGLGYAALLVSTCFIAAQLI